MQDLAALELEGELDFVPFCDKFASVINFDFDIVLIGFGTQPDFLQCVGVEGCLFVRFANFSFLLIEPFAVIHDSANGRVAVRVNFDEVETYIASLADGHISFDNAGLSVVFINKPNVFGPDGAIYF